MNEEPTVKELGERLGAYQSQMLTCLQELTNEDRMAERKVIIEQQARMVAAVEQLHVDLERASVKLEQGIGQLTSAYWALMKVPVACVIVVAASWAYLYSGKISEHTWLLMLAVAVFPWLGDSISALTKLFGLGRRNGGNNGKEGGTNK